MEHLASDPWYLRFCVFLLGFSWLQIPGMTWTANFTPRLFEGLSSLAKTNTKKRSWNFGGVIICWFLWIIVNLLYIRKRTPWYMMFKCKYLQKLSTVSGQGVDHIDIDVQNRRLFQRKTTPQKNHTSSKKGPFQKAISSSNHQCSAEDVSFQRGSVQSWLNNQKSRDYLWRTYTCLATGTSPIGNISTHSRKGWLFQLSTCSNSWEFIRVS